ncbi:hypothetical protein BOX15_Mlig011589g1 [Macrostomum lignano]|uniref:DUF1868 domain-containing protein n=2 Tax=Macrostomum lignano TaxID=282301 RepID=A0A267FAW5_9PLAT|nr:hypothetical protein BOX15_Mlig011589g1 [Macrostomum lignano]
MEQQPHPISPKIDSTGAWSYFPGVTVICPLPAESRRRLESAAERALAAQPTLSRYFAPLPAASYHVTIAGVTKRGRTATRSDWLGTVRAKTAAGWPELADNLRRMQLKPAVVFKRFFSPNASIVGFDVALADESQNQLIEEARRLVCEGGKLPQYQALHCTLGYQYQRIPAAEEQVVKSELAAVQASVRQALLAEPPVMQLEAARLCWYRGMVQFIEWDGRSVPEELVADREVGSSLANYM